MSRHTLSAWSSTQSTDPVESSRLLVDLEQGEQGTITAVGAAVRAELLPMGIRPHKRLTVRAKEPFGGPIVIAVGQTVTSISRQYAKHIKLVQP